MPFNRWVWAVMVLVLAALAYKTRDDFETYFAGVGTLQVQAEPGETSIRLKWRGKIAAPMAQRIAEVAETYRDDPRPFVLTLSSPGGSLDHGAEVIRLLDKIKEKHKLETVVEDGRRCASMCVPVYLQGQPRVAGADAQFMFHEVSFREYLAKENSDVPEAARARATDELFDRYFASAGVSPEWIRTTRTQMSGGNDVWKTARELMAERSGIVQEITE